MYEEVKVLVHSSIRITGDATVYFDPFKVEKETNDADIILVTHEHFDHYSPADVAKVKNDSTVLVCPKSMEGLLADSGIDPEFIELVEAGDEIEINDVTINVIPAYNVGKKFHPQENQWVGYLVTMNSKTYYVAGDTDINEDVKKVRCNVALLPCGGTYTMSAEEAAELAKIIKPDVAIPTHYGDVAGAPGDGKKFVAAVAGEVETLIQL